MHAARLVAAQSALLALLIEQQGDNIRDVLVRPREGTAGGLNVIHVPEPPHPGNIEQHEHWTLWLKDELLAEWDHDPR